MGYVDALLSTRINEILRMLQTHRAEAKAAAPDFGSILSQAMAAVNPAASDTAATTDATETSAAAEDVKALYTILAQSEASGSGSDSALTDYADLIRNSIYTYDSGAQSDELNELYESYGLGTGSGSASNATQLYLNMMASMLREQNQS